MPDAAKPTDGAGLTALAKFAARTDAGTLPAAVVARAQACLLYGLAVGIASTHAKAAHIATATLDFEYADSAGKSTRFIDQKRMPAGAAAFANAVLMHARVQEDAHPAGHVGVVVVPTALAVAEQAGASGAELLASLVAGYEVALRIGRDHAADLSNRGFRTTPCYGVFGAAAATARLLRLDERRALHALALAANSAGGLREFVNAGSGEYPFHAGFAARNGISAANCALHEAEAAVTTLDGSAGFYRAFGEPGKDYGARLSERLGEEFEMLSIAYKPYPTCQFHRSVIHGVLELRRHATHQPLQSLVIRMHPFEAEFFGVTYKGPFTTFAQTFMSAPFCAALAWSRGDVTYQAMHDFDNPDVAAAVARIEVIADPARQRYQPLITMRMTDGTTKVWEDASGAAGFSLTWEAATQMTTNLCREVGVTTAATADLIRAVERIADAPDVASVTAAVGVAIGTLSNKLNAYQ